MTTAPTNLTAKQQEWEYQGALLWSQYREADAERSRILSLYTSWCCFGDRPCRCDFHTYATTAERERVQALDVLCDDVCAERIVLVHRLDRCRRVMAVCAMRPVRVPGVVAMREAA